MRIPLLPVAGTPTRQSAMKCAALVCTAGCPTSVTESLADSLPNVCFDCYSSEVSSALALCPHKDIYILISAEDIIGIEEEWLNANTALKGVSLKERNVFITAYDSDYLTPDWDTLLASFTSRGAVPALLEPAPVLS
ncbi:hypothetical protein [Thalassolituus maritimus]|uniref:Uncharacterized protein n=1 Tax=Thalassolituus maritimus TaxID=484498 RepID=A0ABQ0A307_9GAMM